MSRVPASARQSQNVPVSYPRGVAISPVQATLYAHLQGFCLKPSDGLEPSTPSLPCAAIGNRSQPTATVFASLSRFRGLPICHRLPSVATALLHRCSILSAAGEVHKPAAHATFDRLADVGLGYLSLGQPLTSLSGRAQRPHVGT